MRVYLKSGNIVMEIRHELIANSFPPSLFVFAGMFNSLDRISIAIYICSEYVIQSESNLCFNFWGFMDELLSSFACSISGKFLRKLPVDIAMATALASCRPRPLPLSMEFRHLSACKNLRQLQMLAQVKYVERALFLSLYLSRSLCAMPIIGLQNQQGAERATDTARAEPTEQKAAATTEQQQQRAHKMEKCLSWLQLPRYASSAKCCLSLCVCDCVCVCGEVTYSCHMNLQLLANELLFAVPPCSLTV